MRRQPLADAGRIERVALGSGRSGARFEQAYQSGLERRDADTDELAFASAD